MLPNAKRGLGRFHFDIHNNLSDSPKKSDTAECKDTSVKSQAARDLVLAIDSILDSRTFLGGFNQA